MVSEICLVSGKNALLEVVTGVIRRIHRICLDMTSVSGGEIAFQAERKTCPLGKP